MSKTKNVTEAKDSREMQIATLLSGIKNSDRVIGGFTGAKVGTVYTLTGVISKLPVGDPKKPNFFLAAETEEGINISLKQLIGAASAEGYLALDSKGANEGYDHNFQVKEGNEWIDAEPKKVKPTVEREADLDDYHACPARTLDAFCKAYYPKDSEMPLQGLQVTYAGKAVRTYIPTKGQTKTKLEEYEEMWKAGKQRCITQAFWVADWSKVDAIQ